MKLFFAASVIDDIENPEVNAEHSVHGPFRTESKRNTAITEFQEENDSFTVVIIPINAEVDHDDVNLIVPD